MQKWMAMFLLVGVAVAGLLVAPAVDTGSGRFMR